MLVEEGVEEEGEVLDVLPVLVGLADISGDGKHLRGGVQICEGLLCYIHVPYLLDYTPPSNKRPPPPLFGG